MNWAVLLGLLLSSNQVLSQSRHLRKAEKFYESLSYARAIPHFEKYLSSFPTDSTAIYKLAESYRQTHRYREAGREYNRLRKWSAAPTEFYYNYAHTLMESGRYEEARDKFTRYYTLNPEDQRGKRFALEMDRIIALYSDSGRVYLELAPFCTEASEFGPFVIDHRLIYAAAVEKGKVVGRSFEWLDQPFLDLYEVEVKDRFTVFPAGVDTSVIGDVSSDWPPEDWEKPRELEGGINTQFHESSITTDSNRTIFLFSRNNIREKDAVRSDSGVILLKIYQVIWDGRNFVNQKELSFNSDNYSCTHPSLSPDGKVLFFTSDMPGGYGQKDIWYSLKTDTAWSAPINAGPEINTAGNESFPFFHADSILYFSSDGHPGLGHLDIFLTDLKEGSEPENMGYPINTAYDDFAPFIGQNPSLGLFSSNRPDGAGSDDIYLFRVDRPKLQIQVLDSIARLPLENVEVSIEIKGQGGIREYKTDSAGMVEFPVQRGTEIRITARSDEFPIETVSLKIDRKSRGRTIYKGIQMYNPPPSISAIVVDDESGRRVKNAQVIFAREELGDSVMRITDRNGRFAIGLEKNTVYRLTVRKRGFLAFVDVVSTTETSYDGDTIIPMTLRPIKYNEPVVLENIHYDYDKWYIRPDAYTDLEMIARLLQDNPTIKVELSSHTDSRGNDSYNLDLSHMRAMAARNHLILNFEIAGNRILAQGYGETFLVNKCKNGVPCTEEMHEKNRRTEFRIVGHVDGLPPGINVLETREEGSPDPFPGRDKPFRKVVVQDPWADVEEDLIDTDTAMVQDTAVAIGELNENPPVEKPDESGNLKVWRVQLGAFSGDIDLDAFQDLEEMQELLDKHRFDGLNYITVGDFESLDAGLSALSKVHDKGYKTSFLTAWKNGERLPRKEWLDPSR